MGLLGALTTFSALAGELWNLQDGGDWEALSYYSAASVLGGWVAAGGRSTSGMGPAVIWLGVAASSAVGAVGRCSVMAGLERRFDRGIPWGTALVNLISALALGLLVGSNPSESAGRLLGAGFLGSFSTFSTWMVEGVFLAGTGTRRELVRAGLWVAGMLAVGALAYGLGRSLTR